MPSQLTTHVQLNNIVTCLTVSADTLQILTISLKTPFLEGISNTTQSVLRNVQSIRQNKNTCAELLEQTYQLLNAVLMVHIESNTGGELPPSVLNDIGKFTETLHKIHVFVEAQQKSSKVRQFFRQHEMDTLLKECKAGLQQGFDSFQLKNMNIMQNITEMKENTEKRHQEVLGMIEADMSGSDRASFISGVCSSSHYSSNSISMLPSQPHIFHGRDSEIADILKLFNLGTPRIAILGTGGIGKTSLARAIIHHNEIISQYEERWFFIACDSVGTQVELTALIGAHLELKPGRDLTKLIIQYFSSHQHNLLILDNLETLWEPDKPRCNIEEFLSLLTGVEHLALIITMRGAERPGRVAWSHPFLQPLKPLEHGAARQTFIDIADNTHNPAQVDKVLSLTDNMPLTIILMAHLVDAEGCTNVLSRWEEEKTSLISDGYDRRSNLDLSISLSLSSPRLSSFPHSKDLLSLLSILPDGLSDVELMQTNIPIDNILSCKAALIRTSLAYSDEHKRLKALVPIRDYMQKIQPPSAHLVHSLLKYFQALLEFFIEYVGDQSSSSTIARVSSNYSNIQNILCNGLQEGHPDLVNSIYCTCYLNNFSRFVGLGSIPLFNQIQRRLPQPCDHRLETYFIMELFGQRTYPISDPEGLISKALENFKQFNDYDLQCRFYYALSTYYQLKHNQSTAMDFCKAVISLAVSTGNTKGEARAWHRLAQIKSNCGDSSALQSAYEAQKLARVSADAYTETGALGTLAFCYHKLGNYKQRISHSTRARDLLGLCGMFNRRLEHSLMTNQAEVHKSKSEYFEARCIHTRILQQTSVEHEPYFSCLCSTQYC